MKKLVVYLCTGVLVLGLTACGSKNNNNGQENSNQAESSVAVETPEPTQEPVPTEAPVENNTVEITDLTTIRQAVVDVMGENDWPNTEMPPEFLEGYGLTADMYDAFFGEMPMISTNVDTLIIIKAKEGHLEEVEAVVNSYRENLVNDTMQYPMNLGKIQASKIETFGNYVCFVQLGADVMDLLEISDEEVIKHCQEQNELALEAIGKVLNQ